MVAAWVFAHLALLALGGGLVIDYLVGRSSGRRKAVLDTAREILREVPGEDHAIPR